MLKAPPLKSSDLHFSVIKCHCWTYDDNIGPKLKMPSFAILGAYNMFDNKFNQQIDSQGVKLFIGHKASLSTFFIGHIATFFIIEELSGTFF